MDCLSYEIPPPKVTISPPKGKYAATQDFDLVILVDPSPCSVVNISATLNADDITPYMNDCIVHGTLPPGGDGETSRCTDFNEMLEIGDNILNLTVDFDSSESVTESITWTVVSNTEP